MESVIDIKYSISLVPVTFCKYDLHVMDKQICLSFPQILQLRSKLEVLTSPLKLTEIIENDNFVLLFVADKQHLLYLDVPQLLDLKEEIACFFCRF